MQQSQKKWSIRRVLVFLAIVGTVLWGGVYALLHGVFHHM